MIRFKIKIAQTEFSFGLAWLFMLGAGVVAALLLAAYVDALHDSMRRGEAFRQSQQLSDIGAGTFKSTTSRRGGEERPVVLVSK